MTTAGADAASTGHAIYAGIRRIAERRGNATAILCGDREVSYLALLQRADQIAARLAATLGEQPDRLVAILGTPQPDYVAAMLAVLQNRCTYLPLDIDHPRSRNAAIIADAGVDAVLTLGRDDDIDLARTAPPQPQSRDQFRQRPYVIYTSGSTGAPKGSAASAAAVRNVIDFMRARFGFGEASTMLGVTNFAWDLSVPDIYLPISSGGRLVLLPPGTRGDPAAIGRLIERCEVDLMQAAPSMWRLLIESGWRGSDRLIAIAGGETLPEALARDMIPRCRQLWNFYGPAECTVWSSCASISDPQRISLGFALPRTGLHILRDDGSFAAPGQPGEIVISGIGVAGGYLNRPALSAEKFFDLACADGSVAAYRTGDFGHLTPEGELHFSGRRDLMLKIRGHRVEAREIEQHLERHPLITQAVVFGRSGSVSDTMCAVLAASATLEPAAVRDFLRQRLPGFMVPSDIEIRGALALNANMKLDRQKVIAEFHANARPAAVLPRDLFELELLQMLSDITRTPIGLDDALFDGALQSLDIIRFLQRINARIDGALTFADLQQNPTVTHLAGLLRRAKSSEFRQLIELKPGSSKRTLVLFHPGGGTCLPYKPLIDLLPARLTVLGVECPNLYLPRPELFSVEQMVERYYPDIAGLATEGPIGLAGWSLGGYIGYEIARRLRAEGRDIGLVLLMDSVTIDEPLRRFVDLVGKPNVSEFLRGHFAGYWEHLTDQERERQRVTHELALDATLAYRPGRYDGDIVLAKAGQFDALEPGSDLDRMQQYVRSLTYNGWERSCGGNIRVADVPARHNDLVCAASAPLLAELIAAQLR